jgi:hypothetical protein
MDQDQMLERFKYPGLVVYGFTGMFILDSHYLKWKHDAGEIVLAIRWVPEKYEDFRCRAVRVMEWLNDDKDINGREF